VPKTYDGEKTAFSTNAAGKSGTRSMPIILYLSIRPKTLQLIHKRAGNTMEAIGIGKDFLSRTQPVQQLRERMDKWDYMKLKSF
jgi:hypothetical protein